MTARSFGELAGAKLRTAAGKRDSRNKLIGAVHAAAKGAGLDEEDRRSIYAEETGKPSLSDMTLAEIGKVLDRLNRGRAAPMHHRPHLAKVRALWWTLYWLGEVDQPNDQALVAFVRRQTGLDDLRFVDHRNAPPVIEAQKAWAARAGVRWPTAARRAADDAVAERQAVMDAIWLRLIDARAVVGSLPDAYVYSALKLATTDRRRWTARELDEAIKLLGKRLRRAKLKADDR
jgi:hypothetical protein